MEHDNAEVAVVLPKKDWRLLVGLMNAAITDEHRRLAKRLPAEYARSVWQVRNQVALATKDGEKGLAGGTWAKDFDPDPERPAQ